MGVGLKRGGSPRTPPMNTISNTEPTRSGADQTSGFSTTQKLALFKGVMVAKVRAASTRLSRRTCGDG